MTSQFKVYLNRRFNDWSFSGADEDLDIGDRPIATVEVEEGRILLDDLNDVFAATQHDNAVNEHGWPGRPEVTLYVRSLSIGDVIKTTDGQFYAVDRAGFKKVDPMEPCPHCGRSGGGGS